MSTELSKSYDPTEVEPRWYEAWMKAGHFFATDVGREGHADAFTIAIPPPNVTGSLHMGHALTVTIEDALTRVARMRGKNTLWIPGTDHAGIATQVVVERLLRLEGTNRHELGRERFVERVWQWRGESGGRIYDQLRKIGSSLDWQRVAFTMDPGLSRAVTEAFVRLYEEKLIYRSNRLINWCVSCRSVISDLEVEEEEGFNGELFSFAYPFADGSGEIIVATTRPETILGDTAVAVHPDDPRYKDAIGKQLRCPFHDRTIPVIADAILVDPKFGTGAVKVTPAHDFSDFETGKRHSLPEINILNADGTLNDAAAQFKGMTVKEGRKAVKAALEQKNLARGAKAHKMVLKRCSRSNDVLEPIVSPQWYVKMKPLAEPAIAAVEPGANGEAPKVTFTPEEWKKTYLYWMNNIQDWCISRQLWWGHQIPAWTCSACKEITVARETPTQCSKCNADKTHLTQDSDVLDTWFSSALWPFSTLGWPDKTKALETFYPTSVMETGYDILFFWVARMMMFGIHFMKEVPFRRILLHGMVCDEGGDKMSKVKGNVIDPLDLVYGAPLGVIAEHASPKGTPAEDAMKRLRKSYPSIAEMKEGFPAFGADAVRFYLATNPPQAKRINLQLRQMERARNFANKIWNATRFALPYLEPLRSVADGTVQKQSLALADRWVLSRLARAVKSVNDGLEEFRLDECTGAARAFFWDDLCDWYLEFTKPVFSGADEGAKDAARRTLAMGLETSYRMLHPFMPYLTEEVWQKLPDGVRSRRADGTPASHLVIAAFPQTEHFSSWIDSDAERDFLLLQGVITTVRNVRAELGIKPKEPIKVLLRTNDQQKRSVLETYKAQVRMLTIAAEVEFEAIGEKPKGVGFGVVNDVQVLVPLSGLIDPATEAKRLEREIEKLMKDQEKVEKQLANPAFVDRAPKETVEETRGQLAALKARGDHLREALATVKEAGV